MSLVLALLAACGGDAPAPATPAAPAAASTPASATAQDDALKPPASNATAQPGADSEAANPPDADSDADPDAARPGEPAAATPAAPSPAWQPDAVPVAGESLESQLQRAAAAFGAGRLIEGPDNAASLYLAVRTLDPDNPEALAGIERLLEALATSIEAALDGRQTARAEAAVAVVRQLRSDDPRLARWSERIEAARSLEQQLREAQRRIAAGRSIDPPDASAVAVYLAILAQEPEQSEALAGLAQIERDLVARATAAAEAGDYARSDKLLADAARARPGSPGVQDAGSQIVEMRQSRAAELLSQAQAAAARGEVGRAEQLLGQLEQVSVQSQGLEELRAQIERARTYGEYDAGQSFSDVLAAGSKGPEMVVLPAGRFRMGSPSGEDQRRKDEGPVHEVAWQRGFALGKSEVTVAQFRAFVEATGYRSSASVRGRSSIYDERSGNLSERTGIDWRHDYAGAPAEPDLPVVHVSWEDAQAYADWLTRETGKPYRLPSEAEFEYALRAGSQSRYPWGEGAPPRLLENLTGEKDRSSKGRGWTNGFSGYADGFWGPAPVRAYAANRFGLHDTNGNVSEWVADCWHDNYARAPSDGSAWVNPGCTRRVVRGASWASAPEQARSAFRLAAAPRTTHARLGFRVARDL